MLGGDLPHPKDGDPGDGAHQVLLWSRAFHAGLNRFRTRGGSNIGPLICSSHISSNLIQAALQYPPILYKGDRTIFTTFTLSCQ